MAELLASPLFNVNALFVVPSKTLSWSPLFHTMVWASSERDALEVALTSSWVAEKVMFCRDCDDVLLDSSEEHADRRVRAMIAIKG